MAVLIGRAIPSLTDGLKPAQRRVLTAMKWLGLKPDGKYMKSARVEGETMGKLHPHGGAYGVMVTLAAPWNNNLPLIDGQGNWGSSVDGAAASRYTECKLSPFAWDCLLDDSETWQTVANYDGSLQEPTELNTKVPTVLLNGQDGIGVGFATKIPPHSLRDICDAITKNAPLTPSFPTGCDIIQDDGLATYTRTGVGTLRLRAKLETGKTGTGRKTKETLIFTNLPSNTNPEKIGVQIKEALEKGKLDGISEIIDESDLTGDRLTVIAKANTDITRLAQYLYHYTDLESTYSARTLVIDGTKPVELSPNALLQKWQAWRLDRLGVKFEHECNLAAARLNIVEGLLKAIDSIDKIIKCIRSSGSKTEALAALMSKPFQFNRAQADAILEMKLRQLTNLDASELAEEKSALTEEIENLSLLKSDSKARRKYMLDEIKKIAVRYGEKRRSALIDPPEGILVEKGSSRAAAPVAKPRFMKIDMKRGVAEQAKGPRGAIILEKTDKLITVTEDGTIKKVAPNFKGTLGMGYSPVLLAKKETDVTERKYLVVFTLEDSLKAMMVAGSDLARVTSKGKQLLPEGATLKYFGEGAYTVPWNSTRKKKVELFPVSTKQGRPGAKGIKVANINEISL